MSPYLDHNATQALDPDVAAVMAETARERWGNPHSQHAWGRRARAAVEDARERVAALVGCPARHVVFTSGATEANNTVLKGRALHLGPGSTLLVGASEHASVRQPARYLGERGFATAEVAVDDHGRVRPEALAEALERHAPVGLVSVMWANNETGAIQPVAELADVAAAHGVPLHSDAVQAAGKLPVAFADSGVAALSLSAHKLGGPQGVGALVRDPEALAIDPLLHGGGHERGRRAGTENVAGIAGFGKAAELALARRQAFAAHTRELRDRLERSLAASGLGIEPVAGEAERLPNTSCLLLPGVEAETLLMNLDLEGIAVSSGSACASGSLEPSPVLLAMGLAPEQARSSLRVSLGHATTVDEVEAFAERLLAAVARLRQRRRVTG